MDEQWLALSLSIISQWDGMHKLIVRKFIPDKNISGNISGLAVIIHYQIVHYRFFCLGQCLGEWVGVLPEKLGGVCSLIPKSLPYSRPKSSIFPTLLMT